VIVNHPPSHARLEARKCHSACPYSDQRTSGHTKTVAQGIPGRAASKQSSVKKLFFQKILITGNKHRFREKPDSLQRYTKALFKQLFADMCQQQTAFWWRIVAWKWRNNDCLLFRTSDIAERQIPYPPSPCWCQTLPRILLRVGNDLLLHRLLHSCEELVGDRWAPLGRQQEFQQRALDNLWAATQTVGPGKQEREGGEDRV